MKHLGQPEILKCKIQDVDEIDQTLVRLACLLDNSKRGRSSSIIYKIQRYFRAYFQSPLTYVYAQYIENYTNRSDLCILVTLTF